MNNCLLVRVRCIRSGWALGAALLAASAAAGAAAGERIVLGEEFTATW